MTSSRALWMPWREYIPAGSGTVKVFHSFIVVAELRLLPSQYVFPIGCHC